MNHNLINDYISSIEVQLSHLLGKKVTVHIECEVWTQGDIGDITAIVSNVLGVSVSDMIIKNRKADVPEARQLCWYIIKNKCSVSLNTIGKFFGDRDHTTIMYGIRHIQDLLDAGDEAIVEKYERILKAINNNI